jgi:hypothetical protein
MKNSAMEASNCGVTRDLISKQGTNKAAENCLKMSNLDLEGCDLKKVLRNRFKEIIFLFRTKEDLKIKTLGNMSNSSLLAL